MMKASDIKILAEAKLREAFGDGRVALVSVEVALEDNGSEFLDIVVNVAPGRSLPTAEESITTTRQLLHQLAAQGETRFPNMIYVSAVDAA